MPNTNDFSGVKVGDKLWSIELGECVVTQINPHRHIPIDCVSMHHPRNEHYDNNGSRSTSPAASQSLFWSRPEIIAPEKPKRMVKKAVACWVNVYPDGSFGRCERNKMLADLNDAEGRIACVRCTGEYEVEE